MSENANMPALGNLVMNWNPGSERHEYALEGGLTRREYFAGLAMQGAIAAQESNDEARVAAYAVRYADALLAELSK